MTFVLPNPNTPTNGQLGDATPILQNEQAIAQAIASFDGSQINSKTVVEGALADSINPRLRGLETLGNFVYSGCIWSQVSGLSGTMTGGTIYVNGYRTIVTGVGANTFAVSSDTYIDIDYLGNIVYNAVANNATAPTLTANSIRVAKVITSGAAITSVSQWFGSQGGWFGFDGIGNPVYPSEVTNKTLGYVENSTGQTVSSATLVDITSVTIPVIIPANCYRVKLNAEITVSSDTGASSVLFAITDSSNSVQVQRTEITGQSNSAALQTLTLTRKIGVTPGTSITYKLRGQTSGGNATVNNGNSGLSPTILTAERC